jgi:diguanylate cyclase (GGDEF)-like protein
MRRGPLLFLGVAAGYLGLAQFSIFLNDPVNLGAGFWPAAGFTLAVLVLTERRRWGWVLAAAFAAELGGDLAQGYPVGPSVLWAIANCVEPLVGAGLLRRWGGSGPALLPLRRVGQFLVGAVVAGPLVGGTIGTLGTSLLGRGWWDVWPGFVVGDALGVLVVAPLFLCWTATAPSRSRRETLALAVALPVATFVTFTGWVGPWYVAVSYLAAPLLVWAALRFGVRGAAIAVFTFTQIANYWTAVGSGPFAEAGGQGHAVVLLQIFLAIAAVSTLGLAAFAEGLVEGAVVESKLVLQASTDALTGLPNRAALTSFLAERPRSSGFAAGAGILVCDIDHFKVINDGLGHHAGDEVLVEVGRRIRDCVRPSDLVGRLGADEFVVITEGTDADLERLARQIIDEVATSLTLNDGTKVVPGLSVGIAQSGAGADETSLLRDADAALHRAKDLGRNRSYRFDQQLRAQVLDRLLIQTDFQDALANHELSCVYQPEILIATGKLFAFEVLARWEHPTHGAIPPDRFVPVIEDMGSAGRLFDHVLDEALDAQARWAKLVGFHPSIAVNVSASQLEGRMVADVIARALTRRGAPADSLWIEVTESALAADEAMVAARAIHELGVCLAIDDFGTGWSSMARLAGFPWDMVKIDRGFVAALGTNRQADQVVKSTIAMAHALGIPTTAEGVETGEQLEHLAGLGCDVAQGYLIGRPAAARPTADLLTSDHEHGSEHRPMWR